MDATSLCRDGVRKSKVWLQMKLARDTKNKKGFYRYAIPKRKVKKNELPLMSITGKLIKEWRRRLRYSRIFLPQSSLTAAFHTSQRD